MVYHTSFTAMMHGKLCILSVDLRMTFSAAPLVCRSIMVNVTWLHFNQSMQTGHMTIFSNSAQKILQISVGTCTIRSDLLILQPCFNKVDWKHARHSDDACHTTVDDARQHATKHTT